ncbi:MAG: tetratricopeptide repeat protein [Acidobacteriota bacterium]
MFAAIVLVAGCTPQTIEPPADLEPVAHPDLTAIEEVAREQLEAQRATLEAKLRKTDDRMELAGAFGDMGEHYHAYELLPAAIACYRNAVKLDPGSFLWPYYLGTAQQTAGDLEAASKNLEQAIIHRPDDPAALLRLGEVRLALGDAAGASEPFRMILGDADYVAAAHFGLGRAATAAGDASTAVEHFEKVLAHQPDAGIVHHSLGMALRQADRMDEATAHLEEKGSGEVRAPDRLIERIEALAISSGAHLRRGNRALVNGRLDEAAATFRQAVEANPDSAEIRRNLAHVLLRQGQVDRAIEQLTTAAASEPDDVWVHFDLGNAYMSKGFADQAISSFKRAVELDPTLVKGHFNLANALIGRERWQEARPHLDSVLQLEPENDRARYLSAMSSHHSGDNQTAIASLRQLLAEDPKNTVARQGLGSILEITNRRQDAFEVYRDGLDLDLPTQDKIALVDPLAKLAWRLGHRELSVGYWRQATELDPSSSVAFTQLANTLQLTGNRAEARALFAHAVQLDPRNATAWLSEASLWVLDKDYGAARDRLEEALRVAPDHPGINHTLARLLATCPSSTVRNGRRSLALARKALGLENKLEHAETVGMALAELGQFEEAIRWQTGLLNQAALSQDRRAINQLRTTLRVYEARQAVRISGS